MRTNIILAVLSFVIMIGCSSGNKKSFIPGVYVNNAIGKYSIADDTLVIETSGGVTFTVTRKTGFNLIRNGKRGKRNYETEIWNALYDDKTGTLTETKMGKVLTFIPDSGKLVIGERQYKKVK